MSPLRIPIVDSHTGGEPTRVVLEGAVPIVGATMADRRAAVAANFEEFWANVVREPRGSDVLVGALLTPPISEGAVAGVIYFNTVGVLGMCGHGTIGVVETLRHLGRIGPGAVKLDTPVGPVTALLHGAGEVEIRNVVSRRFRAGVEVHVDGLGPVVGDVAFGGNWVFVVHSPTFDIRLDRVTVLTDITWRIRHALERDGITGEATEDFPGRIDHIDIEGEGGEGADSRNFVLCPGGAYDRSPCGTGTSAKLACLYAAGRLAVGEWYVQESVTGSRFRGRVEEAPGGVIPSIVGRAFVTGEGTLIFDPQDRAGV